MRRKGVAGAAVDAQPGVELAALGGVLLLVLAGPALAGALPAIKIGLVVPTAAEMDELTDRIGAIDGVERTTSSIILSAKFER